MGYLYLKTLKEASFSDSGDSGYLTSIDEVFTESGKCVYYPAGTVGLKSRCCKVFTNSAYLPEDLITYWTKFWWSFENWMSRTDRVNFWFIKMWYFARFGTICEIKKIKREKHPYKWYQIAQGVSNIKI